MLAHDRGNSSRLVDVEISDKPFGVDTGLSDSCGFCAHGVTPVGLASRFAGKPPAVLLIAVTESRSHFFGVYSVSREDSTAFPLTP